MRAIIISIILVIFSYNAFAAVGCDLNDPDRDVKRFFPASTGYKTAYLSISREGGEDLLKEIENALGDSFQGTYETIDVPYTVYTIFEGGNIAGYIHGINQKGKFGGLQVFLIFSPDGVVQNFYYQKLSSKFAKDLRSEEFAEQFKGIALSDFSDYDPKSGAGGSAKVKGIKFPLSDDDTDFRATLRAVKKNMILMDIFVFRKVDKI
ncbi:MAG: hypothetical protein LBP51_03670 [Deferribacteraceae bacterium]|jgi:hypothetical protein|nr:hypothetical protein [Deferribacteraceae bacterium]